MIWEFAINGLITGVLYSLMAIGFALVYNTTRIFHIAASGLYVFAAYMLWLFSSVCGFPLVIAAIVAVILSAGLSLLMELLVYRPLKMRNATPNVSLIASIGMMTIIISTITMVFGMEAKTVSFSENVLQIGKISILVSQIIQFVCGAVLLIAFLWALKRTSWGTRLRALSNDERLYETLGHNPWRSRNILFLISGAFIALSSTLTVFSVGLDSTMGMQALIYAMIAIVIGGIGRYWTCVLGGLLLGIIKSLLDLFVAATWIDAITFIILIVLLYVRPRGIAGYKQRTV